MHYAHIIYQSGTGSWSEALQRAWSMHYIRWYMQHGVLQFSYRKRNGELRQARGTLCNKIIPISKHSTGKRQALIDAGLEQPNYSSIAYYDLDKEAWRAFSVADFCTGEIEALVQCYATSRDEADEKEKAIKEKRTKKEN